MIDTIFFNSYASFFNEELTVNAEYTDERNSALLIVGKVGYDSIEQVVKRGHRAVFSFDQDFEIKLLRREVSQIEVDVIKLTNLKSKYTDFIELSIASIPESEETFLLSEVEVLKEKLTTLQKAFTEHQELSREEAAYAKASFDLLIKKLDQSSKSAWKHTASSIGASLIMSISPEHYQQAIDATRSTFQALVGK
ncbi:hypothetical protein [Aeromonas veronii]|uniref:hypothetical protein n=1 Tax=Aeromonas veronii TaxID=654 RepID=UPI003BA35C92